MPDTPAADVAAGAGAVVTDGEHWIDLSRSIPDAERQYSFSWVGTLVDVHY